jgi:hypothetical protein
VVDFDYYRPYEFILRKMGLTTTPRETCLQEGPSTGQLLAAILSRRESKVPPELP